MSPNIANSRSSISSESCTASASDTLPGAVNLTADQPQLGWTVRWREQRNATAQQHGNNSNFDVVHVAGI
jgi:hypothetical protein